MVTFTVAYKFDVYLVMLVHVLSCHLTVVLATVIRIISVDIFVFYSLRSSSLNVFGILYVYIFKRNQLKFIVCKDNVPYKVVLQVCLKHNNSNATVSKLES